MYKWTRILFVWLLMLAIPVQGLAATAMLFCTSSHHSTVGQDFSQSFVVDHHFGLPAQVELRHGAHGKSTSASQSGDLSIGDLAFAKIEKSEDGKCSACATCCIASINVSTQSFNHVAITGSELISFIQKSFVNYIPEGLDHPPKSFLT